MRSAKAYFPVLIRAQNPWGLDLWILRSNEHRPHLGGNKYYKLLGYVSLARAENRQTLVTMAGAHSNHLRAFAELTHSEGFRSMAIIRGEELIDESRHSAEIRHARQRGTECVYVTRAVYRALRDASGEERADIVPAVDFRNSLFVPEGGLGEPGVLGVRAWASEAQGFDTVILPCATGTTAAGFLLATPAATQIVGIAVLNNRAAVLQAVKGLAGAGACRFHLIADLAGPRFGPYRAPIDPLVSDFIEHNRFPADAVYGLRMLAALAAHSELRRPDQRILLVQTYNE